MTEVLFIARNRPQPGALADAVRKLHEQGITVRLAGTFNLADAREDLESVGLDEVHQLPRGIGTRNQAVRRLAKNSSDGMSQWLQVQRDGWLRKRAAKAHMLVALDTRSVYTVWRLAQYNRKAEAQFGAAAAVRRIAEMAAAGELSSVGERDIPTAPTAYAVAARDVQRVTRRLPLTTMRYATHRRLMRSAAAARLWRAAVAAPGMPGTVRATMSRQVAEGMALAGRRSGAQLALATAAEKISDLGLRADLLDEAASLEVSKGISPKQLDKVVAAHLAHADERFAAGDQHEAARALSRALRLGFHRVHHIDQLTSPLAKDAKGFVAPFHRSKAMRAMTRERGRIAPAAPAPTDRPLRLLVMTSANKNFLGHILDRYDAHPGVELRYLDLAEKRATKHIAWAGPKIIEDRLAGGTAYEEQVERLIRPHLDWADTVFLDWSVGPAAMLTTIDPGDTRVVIRLHSYEAFTRWPLMTDFSRVDDVVFVAEHVKDLTTSMVPQLTGPQAPRLHVLDNAMDLTGFGLDKDPDARFTLGLIGISQVAKDPLWALDVLDQLRAKDERYRLMLVGGDMNPKTSRATKVYLEEFEARLEPLVESGAVVRFGPTDDVPSALASIGTILSSSVREGCHVGLMEGAASAAVPVVRDWPFYAGRPNSARTLYPEGWVVSSPEEAAARILETTDSEQSWLTAGKLAAEHALTQWDWPVVSKQFDRLFLGDQG